MKKPATASMKKRLIVCVVLMTLIGFTALVGRLFALQIIDPDDYAKKARQQQLYSVTINANRGTIFDRNMKTLALSATAWTVFISPAEIRASQLELIADGLSQILDINREMIISKSQNKNRYHEVVKSKIEKEMLDSVIKFINDNDIDGIYYYEDTKRYYPYGSFASTLLGFVNSDNTGAYGLEAWYNKTLSGLPGRSVSMKNAWGSDMPLSYNMVYDPTNGNSVVLTIDEVVQHFVERHLETAVVAHGVKKHATAIVMDVTNGEILAMASMPDYDPNNPREIKDSSVRDEIDLLTGDAYLEALGSAQFQQWRNKAVSDPYEPGSVFKIITAAAALEEGAVKVEDRFSCPGYIIVGSERIRCWKLAGHGGQDFANGLMNSCNPVFITVGQKLGSTAFDKYFQAFGLSEKTGVDLPGEADNSSLVHHDYGIVELASSSMGQTFKVTPLQMITAVAAAVNGGYLYEPQIVKQIIDSDGTVVQNFEPILKRQVISEETSRLVAQLCEGVVTGGSGRNAYVPGYRIGGKTGTSQKIDLLNQTGQAEYVVSFLGFAPADDPKIAVLVLLDEPDIPNPYGSVIAAPVVGAIMADVLPYLGIEPKYTEAELAKIDVAVPNVVGKVPHDAQYDITQRLLYSRVIGTGGTVVKQVPPAGHSIPRGGTVILYTEIPEDAATTLVKVPNVINLTGKQANQTIINAGLNIKITGSGIEGTGNYAASQYPDPGSEVEMGSVVTVNFINKELLE